MNYNPRDPDLLAWLAALPTETEYVMRCALMTVLPSFRQNSSFKRRTEALRAKLAPDEVAGTSAVRALFAGQARKRRLSPALPPFPAAGLSLSRSNGQGHGQTRPSDTRTE